jgi:hypothetical protein
MIRASTEHNDQTSDEQSQDRYNLNRGEYELGFSVDRNGEDVQKEDDDDDDGDPYGGIVSNWKSEDVGLDRSGVLTSLLGPRS